MLGGGCQDSLLARKMQAGTGGCKGHLFCLHLLTIPTSQRHISKLFVWESVDLLYMLFRWSTWWLTLWPTWQLTCSKPSVKSLKYSKTKCIGPNLFDAKCTRLTCLLCFGSSFAPLRPAPWIFTLALPRGQMFCLLHERIDGFCLSSDSLKN